MNRRQNSKVPALLLLLVAMLLIAVTAGCERKVEGTVAVESPVAENCFDCHNGQQDAQQGEWANSVHASGANVDYTSRDGSDCVRCHNQDGFIEWVTTGVIGTGFGNAKAIGCFACHNPHETGDYSRRSEAAATLVTGDLYDVGTSNICARCHQARGTDPNTITDNYTITSSRFGPHHGPQSDMLNGTIGYEAFPGYTKTETLHRSLLTDGCVDCHMGTGRTHAGYEVGGHSKHMSDGVGNDLTGNCQDAACHGAGTLQFDDATTGDPYDFILTSAGGDGYQTIIQQKLDSLQVLLEAAGIYNPANGRNNTGTFADGNVVGAYWNWIMIGEDHSHGLHNWQYANSLLDASIAYLAP